MDITEMAPTCPECGDLLYAGHCVEEHGLTSDEMEERHGIARPLDIMNPNDIGHPDEVIEELVDEAHRLLEAARILREEGGCNHEGYDTYVNEEGFEFCSNCDGIIPVED